jgi:Rrf2 family iron-sulfur cluster assembly transcriptional regulator
MLSRTADHALRALLFLARQEGFGPVTVDRIADNLGAPRNYLGKTLHSLAVRGLVEGVRGPAGGYRLGSPPDRILVSDLLEALDETRNGRGICLLGDRPCNDRDPCTAHDAWVAVLDAAWTPFRTTTLADLLSGSASPIKRDDHE